MIVQWCVKGLTRLDDDGARAIIVNGRGIICRWWQAQNPLPTQEISNRLTRANLDRHINHFTAVDPSTGRPFCEQTPFISLSAGCVERDAALNTNIVHRARRTALAFATEWGQEKVGYLYECWVLLAPRPSVEVEGVAEEVRDLNSYRRFSPYQTEGEVTAKIIVPANQIARCEKWAIDLGRAFRREWTFENDDFIPPTQLSNVRELV